MITIERIADAPNHLQPEFYTPTRKNVTPARVWDALKKCAHQREIFVSTDSSLFFKVWDYARKRGINLEGAYNVKLQADYRYGHMLKAISQVHKEYKDKNIFTDGHVLTTERTSRLWHLLDTRVGLLDDDISEQTMINVEDIITADYGLDSEHSTDLTITGIYSSDKTSKLYLRFSTPENDYVYIRLVKLAFILQNDNDFSELSFRTLVDVNENKERDSTNEKTRPQTVDIFRNNEFVGLVSLVDIR